MIEDISTATPEQIDGRIVELATEADYAIFRRENTARMITYARRAGAGDSITSLTEKAEKLDARILEIGDELGSLNAEYRLRGGWTRVHVVPGGHAHRDTGCHTLYPTTRISLYPPLSDKVETEIVEAAGDRACTHCYPTAPVDKPTTIVLAEETDRAKVKAAKEEARAKKAADKAAKAITAPDGSRLIGNFPGDYLDTERAAQSEYCQAMSDLANVTPEVEATYYKGWRVERAEYAKRLLEAIACKHGETPEQARERLAKAVNLKRLRDRREWVATAKRLGL